MAERKIKLGTDFHGVIAADAPLIWQHIRFSHNFPKDCLKDVDMAGFPSPVLFPNLDPGILEDRKAILADPAHLCRISPCMGITLGLPLITRVTEGEIYMISAMQEFLRGDVNALLKRWELDSYLPDRNIYLRKDRRESPESSKIINARKAAITYMIEDDPVLVDAFVKEGIKVIHIVNGYGELGAPNGPDVIRFGSLFDFAIEAATVGSIEGIFENKQEELQNAENLYRIYTPNPPFCTDKDFACKIRGLCFLTSEKGRFYIGPGDSYLSYNSIRS
ncbi:MAG: hypothetical protein NUV73_00430 [Candidatus Daviesbacteria bacterium]|nr:hypothetical protein [Candidatus Daviesbacteria bacterium]